MERQQERNQKEPKGERYEEDEEKKQEGERLETNLQGMMWQAGPT